MKNIVRAIATSFVVVFAIGATGCATLTAEQRAERVAQLKATTPVCEGEADCKAKWDAAQLWIVQNAGRKLQITTDVVLETYGSTDMSIAVQVTKQPVGSGKNEILVKVYCGNPFGCAVNQWDAALNFNKFVSAAKP